MLIIQHVSPIRRMSRVRVEGNLILLFFEPTQRFDAKIFVTKIATQDD